MSKTLEKLAFAALIGGKICRGTCNKVDASISYIGEAYAFIYLLLGLCYATQLTNSSGIQSVNIHPRLSNSSK